MKVAGSSGWILTSLKSPPLAAHEFDRFIETLGSWTEFGQIDRQNDALVHRDLPIGARATRSRAARALSLSNLSFAGSPGKRSGRRDLRPIAASPAGFLCICRFLTTSADGSRNSPDSHCSLANGSL